MKRHGDTEIGRAQSVPSRSRSRNRPRFRWEFARSYVVNHNRDLKSIFDSLSLTSSSALSTRFVSEVRDKVSLSGGPT